jgi:hypothetical protein
MSLSKTFAERGYLTFPLDGAVLAWAEHARGFAAAAARDPAQAHWLRCGGTWFVGVDALPNDSTGRVAGGPPLQGAAMDFIAGELGLALPLHRAQVSVCYPGYPKPYEGETPAAFQFRLKRDAAHVDGLLAEGPEKRRYVREPHAYILGLPLTRQSADAAPLVVWEGSHLIMRKMFRELFAGHSAEDGPDIDVTEAYQAARRQAFADCRRIELPSNPGEATLLDRHLLHGVAPWGAQATAPDEGRMIAYFRPETARWDDWLTAP